MNTQTAYPLSWPAAWQRTPAFKRGESRFFVVRKSVAVGVEPARYQGQGRRSMVDCTDEIIAEIERLGAQRLVISTNVELRQDGLPMSNRRPPTDAGAAIYFQLKGKPCVLACDKWNRVEDNLWAIAKHIEALRGQERWGVGSVEQAFAGYTALPAPGQTAAASWYQILGVPHDAPFATARAAYLAEAKKCHVDAGGSHEAMVRLNIAWDQARQWFDQQKSA